MAATVSIRIPIAEMYGISSAAELDTDVINGSTIRLSREDGQVLGEHSFPCNVDPESCNAKFIKSKGILDVSAMPLVMPATSSADSPPLNHLAALNLDANGTGNDVTRDVSAGCAPPLSSSPAPPHPSPLSSTASAQPSPEAVKLAEGIDCEMLGRSLGGWGAADSSSSLSLPGTVGRGGNVDKKKAMNQMCQVAKMLKSNGYAVLNSFVPDGLIKKAREEIKVMEKHYVAGEIWLGRCLDHRGFRFLEPLSSGLRPCRCQGGSGGSDNSERCARRQRPMDGRASLNFNSVREGWCEERMFVRNPPSHRVCN